MQALFRKAQLKALVDIHSTEFQSEGLGGGYLSPEEINIIRGALDMTEKKAFVGMTPLDKVRMFIHLPVRTAIVILFRWTRSALHSRPSLGAPHWWIHAAYSLLKHALSSTEDFGHDD